MTKRLMNKRKYIADIYSFKQYVGNDDRPVNKTEYVRKAYYNPLSITSEEKYLSEQNKSSVVKRIEIVFDANINEVNTRIKIGDVMYIITRIWSAERQKRMELSLAYVDNKKATK